MEDLHSKASVVFMTLRDSKATQINLADSRPDTPPSTEKIFKLNTHVLVSN